MGIISLVPHKKGHFENAGTVGRIASLIWDSILILALETVSKCLSNYLLAHLNHVIARTRAKLVVIEYQTDYEN
jgi:hypothetical protein